MFFESIGNDMNLLCANKLEFLAKIFERDAFEVGIDSLKGLGRDSFKNGTI
jgi:hypothetical protein